MEKIIVKEVGMDPVVKEVNAVGYELMSNIVGGMIEHITVGGEVDLWVNDEGKLLDMPINFVLSDTKYSDILDTINGDVFFCSNDGPESVGLSDAQIKWIMNHFDTCPYAGLVDETGVTFFPVWAYDPTVTL